MDDHRLKVFCTVAKTLNFSRAAEENFITQSAVSRIIKGLEEELGVQLIHRHRGNIALTSMHTVWIREHNHQVDRFKELMPDATNDELFKAAKLVVEAEYQNIVFKPDTQRRVCAESARSGARGTGPPAGYARGRGPAGAEPRGAGRGGDSARQRT